MLYLENSLTSDNDSKLVHAPFIFKQYNLNKDMDLNNIYEEAEKIAKEYIEKGYKCEQYFYESKYRKDISIETTGLPFISMVNEKKKIVTIRFRDDKRCYCLNCKKFVEADIETFLTQSYSHNDKVYICPHCKTSCSENSLKYINVKYNTFNESFLDDNKLKIKSGFLTFKEYNQHIIVQKELNVVVMNLDTGMTYLLPPIINGKVSKKFRLMNISYDSYATPSFRNYKYSNNCKDIDVVFRKSFDLIREYKIKKNGSYIPTIKEQFDFAINNGKTKFQLCRYVRKDNSFNYNISYDTNDYYFYDSNLNLKDLMKLNRFPYLNIYFDNDIYELSNFRYINAKKYEKAIKIRGKIKQHSTNPTKEFCEILGVPYKKSLRKAYSQNIFLTFYYKKLEELGIKLDNIIKLFNLEKEYSHKCNLIMDHFVKLLPSLKTFPTYNENNFINKIVNYASKNQGDYAFVADTLKTIYKIISSEDSEEYVLDLREDMRYLHDTSSSDYRKLSVKNKTIEYDKKQLKVNGTFNGLNFALAKDTHELIEVGAVMNICVGSYRDSALEHRCYIVIARDNQNNPIICIEIKSDFTVLSQTKLKFNKHPEEDSEEYKAILEWCHHANMIPDNYEINHYKTTEEYMLKHKNLIEKFNKTAKTYEKITLPHTAEAPIIDNVEAIPELIQVPRQAQRPIQRPVAEVELIAEDTIVEPIPF